MAAVTAHTTFVRLAFNSESNTTAPDPTRRKPTARPNASSRPPCVSGPTQNTGPTPSSETNTSVLGLTTTTSSVLMVASTTGRPSAERTRVQPPDDLQVPQVHAPNLKRQPAVASFSSNCSGPLPLHVLQDSPFAHQRLSVLRISSRQTCRYGRWKRRVQ
jgi:hypothetical protein